MKTLVIKMLAKKLSTKHVNKLFADMTLDKEDKQYINFLKGEVFNGYFMDLSGKSLTNAIARFLQVNSLLDNPELLL